MDLNVQNWKEFKIPSLFDVDAGIYHYSDEYEDGDTPYVSASDTNNGIGSYISLRPDFEGNKITTGKVGCTAYYQPDAFCATSDVNVLSPKFDMSAEIGMFISRIINFNENYKWAYGRQCRVGNTKAIIIKLPIQHNSDGTPVIDADKTYSDEGYIPDWQFMEDYIKSLHSEPITTTRGAVESLSLGVDKWKEFNLSDVCHIDFGNKFDNDKMTHDEPSVNFVGRTADNNGVRDFVDKIDGVKPYQAGSITVALGGSIGSCFIQAKPFYTSQNVAVLSFDEKVSNKAKLFFANIFMYEVSGKFVAFGRELNKHMKTDFTMYLPVQCDANGFPVTDANDKYIPDWDFMERYIDSLPYSDKIA